MGLHSVDASKGILSVPVLVDGSNTPFLFNSDTSITETRSGFTFGFKTQDDVEVIAKLQANLDADATVLLVGTDYLVEPGKIFFAVKPPEFLIAPRVERNLQLIWRNFGFLVDFFRDNSAEYRRQVQGLWFALVGGPSLSNMQLGVSAILDLPYTRGGTVRSIRPQSDGSVNVVIDSETINVPKKLVDRISVVEGQVIDGFQAIVNAVLVEDFIVNPDFASKAGIPKILQFFTFLITVDADVVTDLIGPLGSLQTLFSGSVDFVERAKPAYTDFVMDVLKELEDKEFLEVSTESDPRVIVARMPSDLAFNPVNLAYGVDGLEVALPGFDELAYRASGGDDRLDLGTDDLIMHDYLTVIDIPTSGPESDIGTFGNIPA